MPILSGQPGKQLNLCRKLLLFLILLISSGGSSFAAAEAEEDHNYFDTLTVAWENDAFVGTDKDYTNGFKLTWSTPYGARTEEDLPSWSLPVFARLPALDSPDSKLALSFSIGQTIYNPEDTDSAEIVEDDRPYAGFTFLSTGFHARTRDRKDTWQFLIGLVGPASMAEDVQNLTHDLIGTDRPEGWDNQLKNEITFDIVYERRWQLWSTFWNNGLGMDLIPHLGGQLGTARTHLNSGVEVRFGWNLDEDYGSCPVRGGCEIRGFSQNSFNSASGFHLFVSAEGRAVARDIFLDGNTFRDSHSVDKKSLVGELMGGFVWQLGRGKLTYAYVYRTKEFDGQDDNSVYGLLTFSWNYR